MCCMYGNSLRTIGLSVLMSFLGMSSGERVEGTSLTIGTLTVNIVSVNSMCVKNDLQKCCFGI